MKRLGLAMLLAASATGAQAQKASRATATNSLQGIIEAEDYPAEAVANDEQGTVRFRLDIGLQGEVRGCTIVETSGSPLLDATSCRLLRERAKFSPATDRRGRPVPDTVTNQIVWRLEETALPPRLEAASFLWGSCVLGEASRRTLSSVPLEQIADDAFRACVQLETTLVSEMAKLPPKDIPFPGIEAARRELRASMVETLGSYREILQAPDDPIVAGQPPPLP